MYNKLSQNLIKEMTLDKQNHTVNPYAFIDANAQRRGNNVHDLDYTLRSPFIKDVDKIMNCPYFSRYQDKTQVFSLYKNDDITRRWLHVQFVSRIARTIGKALNLNLELIESIALGHDIGHTPFGHAGETLLSSLLYNNTGRKFYHNVHSVRVLDKIFPYNITLQTLDGIICHDGELELKEYAPSSLKTFEEFDNNVENCYTKNGFVKSLTPSTLEGCVVRISDIIAYLGKDRQDAQKTHKLSDNVDDIVLGSNNAEIINNLTVNIIENSYSKPYIKLDDEHFEALKKAKAFNYQNIYIDDETQRLFESKIRPMMTDMYNKLLDDLTKQNLSSPIYKDHIDYINNSHYRKDDYLKEEKNQIVVDYIASMTDDYFIDLYNYLFTDKHIKIQYHNYFD